MNLQHTSLYTYSGKVSFPEGAPSLLDIAVSLCREGRYVGAGVQWWPVGLHSFVVADLLPDRLKLHGLLHDAHECITGDIPTPVKTPAIRALQAALQFKIYESMGLPMPSREDAKLIKEADGMALCGEVYTVGTTALREEVPRCRKAESLVQDYLHEYPVADCIDPSGDAVEEFLFRFDEYKRLMPKKGSTRRRSTGKPQD